MPVPTFDQLLWPVLELAAKTEITRQIATAAMIEKFSLTDEERQDAISSGTPKIANRTGWAMSHLTKAALIERVAKFTYKATGKGLDYLKTHSGPITVDDLKQIDEWREGWESASNRRKGKSGSATDPIHPTPAITPEELIDGAVDTLREDLRDELLEHLSQINPYRFERVVLDLLFAMGYGGSRAEAAQVTKKSGDEGIDGVINEDRLGLDVIYVQAKRWKSTVGRVEIQSFVGALAGKQAHKGIFITTSDFNKNAIEFAQAVPQKVILIDGQRLAALMIEHGVGVSTSRSIEIKRIDSDYFEES